MFNSVFHYFFTLFAKRSNFREGKQSCGNNTKKYYCFKIGPAEKWKKLHFITIVILCTTLAKKNLQNCHFIFSHAFHSSLMYNTLFEQTFNQWDQKRLAIPANHNLFDANKNIINSWCIKRPLIFAVLIIRTLWKILCLRIFATVIWRFWSKLRLELPCYLLSLNSSRLTPTNNEGRLYLPMYRYS